MMVNIESYTAPGEYLIAVGEGGTLKFTKLDTIQIENCFIIRENSIGSDSYSFSFESVKPSKKAISETNINGQDMYRLEELADMSKGGSSTETIMKQVFYPLISKNDEDGFNTFKLAKNENDNSYMGYFNGYLKGYKTTSDSEVMNNISFKVKPVINKVLLSFTTLLGDSLYGYNNGIVGIKNENQSKYEIIKLKQNFDVTFDDQEIYLKNIKNGKYLILLDSGLLGEKSIPLKELDKDNIFILRYKAGFYQLLNNDGEKALNYKGNGLIFKLEKSSRDSESILKIKVDYIV
jgi:hypothetical protein